MGSLSNSGPTRRVQCTGAAARGGYHWRGGQWTVAATERLHTLGRAVRPGAVGGGAAAQLRQARPSVAEACMAVGLKTIRVFSKLKSADETLLAEGLTFLDGIESLELILWLCLEKV